MSWHDRQRQASFRGVPFQLQGDEHGAGRRKSIIEAPGRDEPFVQDLGRATETVRLDAFVAGPDYDLQRDALLDALHRPGVGELVHPQYGNRQAVATEVKVVWSNTEQGLARFALTFVLNPTEIALGTFVDGLSLAESASSNVATSAQVALADAIGAAPSNVDLSAARSASRGLGEQLSAAVESTTRFQGLQDRAAKAAALIRRVQQLSDITLTRGTDWALWLNELQGTTTDFGGSFSNRRTAFRGLLDLARLVAGVGGVTVASRVQGAAASSILGTAVVSAAEVGTGWDSRTEAVTAQDEVLEQIDLQLEQAPDGLIGPLEDLRVAVVNSIPAPDVALPELSTYQPAETVPAILISHQLYLRPDRGDEIATRNRVPNPGLVAAAPLEVLVSV